ncbi:MAG: NAD-dependent epimerase/dehydratase family protein, partial [Chlamydiia bacterium]|nr:NAD-dependent epimerase/dehydratase family protein [Chlamydiia bacterium]
FTVYGPWGRPDMAYYKFTKAILEGQPIPVFNHGQLERDFTYIDDIVAGIRGAMESGKRDAAVYNLGNEQPVTLEAFISAIENALGRKAIKNYLPMQAGDVYRTYADVASSFRDFGYAPRISIQEGLGRFVEWYLQCHSTPVG